MTEETLSPTKDASGASARGRPNVNLPPDSMTRLASDDAAATVFDNSDKPGKGRNYSRDVWNNTPTFAENILQVIGAVFLCVAPILLPLAHWKHLIPRPWYGVAMGVSALAYFLVLVAYARRGIRIAESMPQREPMLGQVDREDIHQLINACSQESLDITGEQIEMFAASVLSATVVRPRITDKYFRSGRAFRKLVTVDFNMQPWANLATDRAGDDLASFASIANGEIKKDKGESLFKLIFRLALQGGTSLFSNESTSSGINDKYRYVALTLPLKGELYDDLIITDAGGQQLPSLSQREYRLLAAKTLRALLLAAFPRFVTDKTASRAEVLALEEIMRPGQAGRGRGETAAAY
jgi:hypothetical protein